MEKDDDRIEVQGDGIMIGLPFPFKKQTTVAEHYGVKNEDFTKLSNQILASLVVEENMSTTLDKFFSNLSAEDRIKVYAYADAIAKYRHLQKHGGC